MIRKCLKTYIFLTILLSDFLLFAQDPGTGFEDENGDTDGSVEEAPINGKLLWLAIAGIAFTFYYFRRKESLAGK